MVGKVLDNTDFLLQKQSKDCRETAPFPMNKPAEPSPWHVNWIFSPIDL
jgi:hypothetical protein